MWQILTLLSPALIPSWRFFETIEASPRVQWAILTGPEDNDMRWQEYRPPPAHLSIWSIMLRLFWNPQGNRRLYLVSLAERLTQEPTPHSRSEIFRLISEDLGRTAAPYVRFRLVFVQRACVDGACVDGACVDGVSGDEGTGGDDLVKDVTYLSDPCAREAVP